MKILFSFQIYWIGPLLGGALGGLIHEFVFNTYQDGCQRKSTGEGGKFKIPSPFPNILEGFPHPH